MNAKKLLEIKEKIWDTDDDQLEDALNKRMRYNFDDTKWRLMWIMKALEIALKDRS